MITRGTPISGNFHMIFFKHFFTMAYTDFPVKLVLVLADP